MASTLCTMCSIPTKATCSECKSTWYCSKNCQELDHPLHDLVCQNFKLELRPPLLPKSTTKAENEKAPAGAVEESVLAMVLPVDREFPDLVRLLCGYDATIEANGTQKGKPYISDNQPIHKHLIKLTYVWTTIRNGRQVDVASAAKGKNASNSNNKCFGYLNNGYNNTHRSEALIILYTQNFETAGGKMASRFADVQAADLRYALNAMCWTHESYYPATENPFIIRDPLSWTLGVRVNCMADINANLHGDITKKYESVYVRNTAYDLNHLDDRGPVSIPKNSEPNVVWTWKEISPIAQQLEMPLRVVSFECSDTESCPNVGCAGLIKAYVDPNDTYFAEYPPMHTFIAARSDKKDMTLNQFNVLLSFSFEVCGKLKKYRTQCTARRRRAMEKLLHSDRFEQFFEAYRQEELSYGRLQWKDEVPPERKTLGEPGPTRKYGWREKEQS